MYDSIYMKCLKQAILQRQKVNQWLPRPGGLKGKWHLTANGYGVLFEDDKNVPKLIVIGDCTTL